MHPYVQYSIIHNGQDTEATYVSIDWWMDQENGVHNDYYSAIKDCNLVPCVNIDGLRGYYAKWSNTEKRQIPCDLSYMWNLK